MTERNTKAFGLGTIIAMLLVTCLGLGILLGLFGKKLGIPDNVGEVIVGVIIGYLTATLVHRRQKAIAGTSGSTSGSQRSHRLSGTDE